MSIKVPQETVEYQSHHHCQCDFCNSRRNVNAKKWTISQRAAMLQHAQQRNGCCCSCHDGLNAVTFAKDRSGFDPEYPSPVNQTALNEAAGRNGVPGGNQYTIPNGTTRGTTPNGTAKTAEEQAKDTAAELDRLERLLIMEHKARVKAALEADKLGTLRSKGSENRPQPMPEGYGANPNNSGYPMGMSGSNPHNGNNSTLGGSNYRGDSLYPGASYDGVDAATIAEAYRLAHQCPVTPPPQCRASHKLQHAVNDVRHVAMDPTSRGNRGALQELLRSHGAAGTPTPSEEDRRASGRHHSGGAAAEEDEGLEFGNSLARNATSIAHPVGAGVVWSKYKKDGTAQLTPGAAAAMSVQKNNTASAAAPQSATGKNTKRVTYAE